MKRAPPTALPSVGDAHRNSLKYGSAFNSISLACFLPLLLGEFSRRGPFPNILFEKKDVCLVSFY